MTCGDYDIFLEMSQFDAQLWFLLMIKTFHVNTDCFYNVAFTIYTNTTMQFIHKTNNITECMKNVYRKLYISKEKHVEFQVKNPLKVKSWRTVPVQCIGTEAQWL